MSRPEIEYLQNQISNHISLFFNADGKSVVESELVFFLPYGEAKATDNKAIVIPTDIPADRTQQPSYKVAFNNTELTLWNRLTPPSNGDWEAIPSESAPLWYRNQHGALIPAWDLFGNLFRLLTFGEENGSLPKDSHGRYQVTFSPRLKENLLEIPAFNEAVAALMAAYTGLCQSDRPHLDLNGLVKPPVISLSHDCDILLGSDFWTQAVRGVRIVLPLAKLRLPKISNAWWILRNAVSPRRFYFDNITGMIDLERCFRYTSTFYIINGTGGRFGARSGSAIIPELLAAIPQGWDIGMHYNYDTYLDDRKFSAQLEELNSHHDSGFTIGRAHYLRFDSEKSFSFLRKHGIYLDESSGYTDRIGYRNGIAGCFQAWDSKAKRPMDIWECPMTIMEAAFVDQYGDRAISRFSELLYHLSCVGGALTVNCHPGQFFNPEHRNTLGLYHAILNEAARLQAQSNTARSLVDQIR
jgi:hypothetical protein